MKKRRRDSKRKTKLKKRARAGVLFLILALLVLSCAIFSFRKICKSDFFQIQKVKIKGNPGWLEHSVRFLIGANLFDIDLAKAQKLLKQEHSEIETITLSKLWPDTVYISFRLRQPLAIIEAGDNLLVDKDGFFLEKEKYKEQISNLPIIKGITISRFTTAERLNIDRRVGAAFEIINLYSEIKAFGDYPLVDVDVRRISQSTFFICRKDAKTRDWQIMVKIGQDRYREKLRMFEIFLKTADIDWAKTSYIDLRFKEPIVGLKNG